jgi:hypothetical protein
VGGVGKKKQLKLGYKKYFFKAIYQTLLEMFLVDKY